MFNLDKYSDNKNEEINISRESASSDFLARHPYINTIWEITKKAIGFQITRLVLLGVFTIAVFAVSWNYSKSVDIAGGLADAGAKDDYVGFWNIFAKESGHKSVKLNMHPFFYTKGVRELESKFNVEFGSQITFQGIFAYALYDGQDFMVMREEARGRDNERLSLDNSTFFGESADDHCEDYFDGFVPKKKLNDYFVSGSVWRIEKIKNKEDQKRFRCVIGPDVIEDFVEGDKE